ncbi:MAG: glpQ [Verrucomicrobiales bacterium]|nr:glpQ [Verrucomicrobiales bacterium]
MTAFAPFIVAGPKTDRGSSMTDPFHSGRKFVVAHRGASAYAPENTLPAYELAIKQGADYVEQDLQITRDGVLVCAHDAVLSRVTNVEQVFPDRFTEEVVKGRKVKKWYIHKFTVKELKQLDAGSHLGSQFKGVTIPTWQEAIDTIRGKAGLCPETKSPEVYGKLGFDMEEMVMTLLKKNGLDQPQPSNQSTPMYMQSFSKTSLLKLRNKYHVKWPTLWLFAVNTKWTPAMLHEAKESFDSIGPNKKDVTASLVKQAHEIGLKVFPYTFISGEEKPFKDVRTEMSHYLYDLGVDGMFTNNPDQFPRSAG